MLLHEEKGKELRITGESTEIRIGVFGVDLRHWCTYIWNPHEEEFSGC
jgi:hypothetical protein